MTEQEWKNQRSKASANLELLKMKKRGGLVSQEELDEASRILNALMTYQPEAVPEMAEIQPDCPTIPTKAGIEIPVMPVAEFTRLLEELTLQKSEFHKQMAIRCNKLKDIPDHESAKELVDEIDHYYERRTEMAVKINFLKANGRLPEDSGNNQPAEDLQLKFLENLPADKYELSKLLTTILPNLSKARGKLQAVKDQVKRVHYSQKVARLEAEVALIRSRIKALS
ncbi:hypothetical protein HMF3257_20795 [Spirosoma telluris]|uniref:Uncharacterized protein n=2 Tax=Spirosoma telluris TaxID=2183553 RepID=A0A327NKU9_9BACT|nr:hypothetical protein HMF3257_20795 [Spirosoma telluris]